MLASLQSTPSDFALDAFLPYYVIPSIQPSKSVKRLDEYARMRRCDSMKEAVFSKKE